LTLNWASSSDNIGVTAYEIYRNDTLIGIVKANAAGATATDFKVTGLAPQTVYSFTVKAKDAAGNLSAASVALDVTTPSHADADGDPPSAPTGLKGDVINNDVIRLFWLPAEDNVAVSSYEIYNANQLIAVIEGEGGNPPVTTYDLSGLTTGTYELKVIAKDAAGHASINSNVFTFKKSAVDIGDYIQFGKYNNAPILWRVINKDADGTATFLADRILTVKAFDAKGSYHSSSTSRMNNGSNYYKNSTLRQWLNSNSPNNGSNLIDWIQNDPTSSNIYQSYNPYHTEKGFLTDGNFNARERSWIEPFQNKVLLNVTDSGQADGGSAAHTYNSNWADVLQNTDSDAYYQNVTDKIFLPSLKQLKEIRNSLGITGYPTGIFCGRMYKEKRLDFSTDAKS
jgi:hypothetical protein